MKKCSKCPFAINMGTNNYVEMACPFFGYHVPAEFDSEDHEGCNLKFSEAKKLDRLQDQITGIVFPLRYQPFDYKPTEEDLAEEKELQEKRKKLEEIYKAYFEELKKRRKKKANI